MPDPEHSRYFPEYQYKTVYEWHRHWVFNDPEFVSKAKELFLKTRASKKEYAQLAADFMIEASDAQYFAEGKWLQSPADFPFFEMKYNQTKGFLELNVPVSISKEEYLLGWEYLEAFRAQELNYKRNKRRRLPDDMRLIYAVFKQRKAGKTFSEIHLQYQKGTLAGYEGGVTNQFQSVDSLAGYYRKYSPQNLKTHT